MMPIIEVQRLALPKDALPLDDFLGLVGFSNQVMGFFFVMAHSFQSLPCFPSTLLRLVQNPLDFNVVVIVIWSLHNKLLPSVGQTFRARKIKIM